jgi:hypothetical protein
LGFVINLKTSEFFQELENEIRDAADAKEIQERLDRANKKKSEEEEKRRKAAEEEQTRRKEEERKRNEQIQQERKAAKEEQVRRKEDERRINEEMQEMQREMKAAAEERERKVQEDAKRMAEEEARKRGEEEKERKESEEEKRRSAAYIFSGNEKMAEARRKIEMKNFDGAKESRQEATECFVKAGQDKYDELKILDAAIDAAVKKKEEAEFFEVAKKKAFEQAAAAQSRWKEAEQREKAEAARVLQASVRRSNVQRKRKILMSLGKWMGTVNIKTSATVDSDSDSDDSTLSGARKTPTKTEPRPELEGSSRKTTPRKEGEERASLTSAPRLTIGLPPTAPSPDDEERARRARERRLQFLASGSGQHGPSLLVRARKGMNTRKMHINEEHHHSYTISLFYNQPNGVSHDSPVLRRA